MNEHSKRSYIERVNDPTVDAKPCEYGHFECALVDGGPCSDRVEGEREVMERKRLRETDDGIEIDVSDLPKNPDGSITLSRGLVLPRK